jgi:sulfate adenylyltransferase subunit 1
MTNNHNGSSSNGYLNMQLLRFTTAGSVDDGKSTLIGRLLYDSKSIFQDQLDAMEETSRRKGNGHIDLALLTDGLKAEREQGITIDVAYRYFATPKRKFIIADTPGHIQYTRNMVTGASTADLAIILVDARKGITEQTLRHSFIAAMLRITHIVVCINKMDLVGYSQDVYEGIKKHFGEFLPKLDIQDIHFVPISALHGDNVVDKSINTPWFAGETLLHLLEHIPVTYQNNITDARFPVQYIIRPQSDEFPDFRGYAGRVEGGVFRKGDEVTILPSGMKSTIKSITTFDDELEMAFEPLSITISLTSDIDISRGDMIVKSDNLPQQIQVIKAMVCWFNTRPLQLQGKYTFMHTTNTLRCMVQTIDYKMDINALEKDYQDKNIGMNDIAHITLQTTKPIFCDSYLKNRNTGSFVLVDEGTNETVGVGMIEE